MKLYYSDVLAPRKVCALIRHLGLTVDYVYLDLKKGEHQTPAYKALNPNGKVPTLVDGSNVLWEADAILCALAQKAGSDLWPQDGRSQIDVMRWFSWNAQHLYRHGGALYFEHVVKKRFGIGAPDPAQVEAALEGFRRFAGVLNQHLAGRDWLLGERLTVADFSVGVPLPYAEAAGLPIGEFPNVRRWHDGLNALEGWRDPFPARAQAAAA